MIMAVKAILFDLDNTLIDFWKMKEESSRAALTGMINAGLKVEKEEAHKEMMRLFMRLGVESENIFQEFLKNRIGRIDEKMLAAAINAYLKTKNTFMKTYPSVKPVLIELKKRKIKLAIVSDAPKVKVYQRLLAMNIEKYFDFVIGFEDTGAKKKTEIPLKVAIEKLKLEPNEIMMVGDSIKRDVLPAKKSGMIAVLAKYGSLEKVEKIRPDFVLDEFAEILKLV